MTRDEIASVLGPVDDALVADLMATGAAADELREAWGWLHADEALMGAGRPLPGSRVSQLMDLLEPHDDDQ